VREFVSSNASQHYKFWLLHSKKPANESEKRLKGMLSGGMKIAFIYILGTKSLKE